MRSVSIIGTGSTPFGRHKETALEDLAVQASEAALGEAASDRGENGAL